MNSKPSEAGQKNLPLIVFAIILGGLIAAFTAVLINGLGQWRQSVPVPEPPPTNSQSR